MKEAKGHPFRRALAILEPALKWSGGGLFFLSLFIIDHSVQVGIRLMTAGFLLWLAGKVISVARCVVDAIRSKRLR